MTKKNRKIKFKNGRKVRLLLYFNYVYIDKLIYVSSIFMIYLVIIRFAEGL